MTNIMAAEKNSSVAPQSDPDLIITRLVDAPRELLFELWTEPRHVEKWWGPNGFTNPVCELSVRAGGAMRIHMRGPDGTVYPMTGIYQEVVAPERLVYSAAALDESGRPLFEVLHTLTFYAKGNNTRLTLAVRIIKTTPAAARYLNGQSQGWSESLDRLATHIKAVRGIST
jgi:uncharacterized protein YndB with AHSA1/START domain